MRKIRPAIRVLKLIASLPIRSCYPRGGVLGSGCFPKGGVPGPGCYPRGKRVGKRRR
jgi:hypothetical protein